MGVEGEYSIVYGTKAVETFLAETGLSMIMRAHEATQQGVKLCKHAQVMTIFSTSKNHGRVGALAHAFLWILRRYMSLIRVSLETCRAASAT